MPVYEFYCPDCHRIFNFLSRRVESGKRPDCPRCGRAGLEKRASRFAVSRGRKEAEPAAGGEALPEADDSRMEQAMESLAREAEGLDEDDPRQAARLMRRLYRSMGLDLGPGMEEAMRRMEAGEDPDKIEEELGDLLEGEDEEAPLPGQAAAAGGLRSLRRKILPPSVDDTLYEL